SSSCSAIPSATIPTIVATGIRRPRMQGIPPIWFGSTVIRLNGCTGITSLGSRASREPEGGAGLVGGLLIRLLPPRSASPAQTPQCSRGQRITWALTWGSALVGSPGFALRKMLGRARASALVDIKHAHKLAEVFARHRPEVVFDAAAYKH